MRKLWISLPVLVTAALVLSACGGAAPAASSAPAAPVAQPASTTSNAAAPAQPTAAPAANGGMMHDPDPMSDNSYDVHFIDATLEHHAGASSRWLSRRSKTAGTLR
jgi:uncharacterized protein (DUF305 family)